MFHFQQLIFFYFSDFQWHACSNNIESSLSVQMVSVLLEILKFEGSLTEVLSKMNPPQ